MRSRKKSFGSASAVDDDGDEEEEEEGLTRLNFRRKTARDGDRPEVSDGS